MTGRNNQIKCDCSEPRYPTGHTTNHNTRSKRITEPIRSISNRGIRFWEQTRRRTGRRNNWRAPATGESISQSFESSIRGSGWRQQRASSKRCTSSKHTTKRHGQGFGIATNSTSRWLFLWWRNHDGIFVGGNLDQKAKMMALYVKEGLELVPKGLEDSIDPAEVGQLQDFRGDVLVYVTNGVRAGGL